jgi:hypothetical protein
MGSNKSKFNDNNNVNDAGDEHQQLQRSAPKRKFNELANDEEDKPAAAGENQNCGSKKNREDGNDLAMEVCTYLVDYKKKAKRYNINWERK